MNSRYPEVRDVATGWFYGSAAALLVALAVVGCPPMQRGAQQTCPVIKMLAQGCDFVLVEAPDGGVRRIGKQELDEAEQRTSVRLEQMMKAMDAGTDR